MSWLSGFSRHLRGRALHSKLALSLITSLKGTVKRCRSYMRDGLYLPAASLVYQGQGVGQGFETVILIASHRRNSVLVKLVEYYSNNLTDFKYIVLLVISDDDLSPLPLLSEKAKKNLVIIKSANYPVGNKWQLGVEHAKTLNPKSLMICGSDDFLTPEYIYSAVSMIANGYYGVVGCDSWKVIEIIDGVEKLFSIKYTSKSLNKILGAGRLYSRMFLDSCNWTLFEKRFDRGLDYQGIKLALQKNVTIGLCENGAVVSVKGEWAMINPFLKMTESDLIDIEELFLDISAIDVYKKILN